MAQANAIAKLLEPLCAGVEIVKIRTSGDAGDRDRLGAFVSEIQQATLQDDVDLGLHCLKDLPTTRVKGLTLAAHLPREDVREAVLTRSQSWIDLPRDSVVGTGSLRRTSQIAAYRPDLRFRALLGNIDTRMGKLIRGEYDAIVLAVAGLKRLGLLENWSETDYGCLHLEVLEPSAILPSPGQAVLVLECLEDNEPVRRTLSHFNDVQTEAASIAERAFLARFGGGCSVPVAALATTESGALMLRGLIASPDGTKVLRGSRTGTLAEAAAIGTALAEELGPLGGFDIVESVARVGRAN